jgi:hypothetical protein
MLQGIIYSSYIVSLKTNLIVLLTLNDFFLIKNVKYGHIPVWFVDNNMLVRTSGITCGRACRGAELVVDFILFGFLSGFYLYCLFGFVVACYC